MVYPEQHKNIVTALMAGEFITVDDSKQYNDIKNNKQFYIDFFKNSFDFDLKIEFEYCYLVSEKTDENTSRNITVFFSLLCSGIDKDGDNFLEKLNDQPFKSSDIYYYLENSSWNEVLESNASLNSEDNVNSFIRKLEKRNIIRRSNGQYFFTKACKFFINFLENQASVKTSSIY